MNTKDAIGLIIFGAGIGGAIATAVVGKMSIKHGNRQFVNGVNLGIALKELEECVKEVGNNCKHDSD